MKPEIPFANTFSLEEEIALSKIPNKGNSGIKRGDSLSVLKDFNPLTSAQEKIRRHSFEQFKGLDAVVDKSPFTRPTSPVERHAEARANALRKSESNTSLTGIDNSQGLKKDDLSGTSTSTPSPKVTQIIDSMQQNIAASNQYSKAAKVAKDATRVLKKGR